MYFDIILHLAGRPRELIIIITMKNDFEHIFHLGGGRQELIIIINMKNNISGQNFSSRRTPAGIINYNYSEKYHQGLLSGAFQFGL